MTKIVTVVGARPQFVKAAAVSRAMAGRRDVEEVLLHTGQHFDYGMSDVFFEEMDIPKPRYSLGVNSLNHGALTGRMLEKIEQVLIIERPDRVLVYGDTDSTLAGALAARKLNIDVVHVEAGLRSQNMRMPEEVNRILTDRISRILCCPTDGAVANLRAEGFARFDCEIVKTGDVMLDAQIYYSRIAPSRSSIIARSGLSDGPYLLCTIHRAENTDDPLRLRSIVAALNRLHSETRVVLPLHPRTRKVIESLSIQLDVTTMDPVGYFDMLELLNHSSLVLTDSGGVQKEAFFFRKPCVTLRDETEWTELVEVGANALAGADTERILTVVRAMRGHVVETGADVYGSGNAASKVVAAVLDERHIESSAAVCRN